MPIAEPARAVNVHGLWAARATSNPAGGDQLGLSSYPDYVDLRDSGILKARRVRDVGLSLDANGVTERIEAEIVSGNYFDVLGVRPVVGRTFGAGEDRVGSPIRVAVLSHRTWLQRFGGDRGLVGQSIALNGNAYTVIGIAPQGFAGRFSAICRKRGCRWRSREKCVLHRPRCNGGSGARRCSWRGMSAGSVWSGAFGMPRLFAMRLRPST